MVVRAFVLLAARPMQALIVEPSRLVAMMLTNTMGQHGVDTLTVKTGSQALEKLQRQPYDLLCVAYVLGDMDGIDLVQQVRDRNLLGDRPVLMFSATHDKESIERALHAGVTECFSKHQMKELDKFVARYAAGNTRRVSGRVLLIEDSATAALFCMHVLSHMGLEVDHCKTASEALGYFAKRAYDLVLVDYMLAGTETGVTVIRSVRAMRGRKSRTPILAMSAFKDTSRRIEVLRSGANDFVGKPVVSEELEVRIFNLITLQKLVQQLETQHEMMRDMATHDQLTSLYNRYYLHERLPALVSKAEAGGSPLSVAIVDIDHFKRVNDTHGHAMGDRVLAAIAKAMQSEAHSETLLARFGGEEFVAVLPGMSLEDAYEWAEKLRQRVAALRPASIGVTVSLGVATLKPGEDFDALFRRADEAVYRAKHEGRNRVEVVS